MTMPLGFENIVASKEEYERIVRNLEREMNSKKGLFTQLNIPQEIIKESNMHIQLFENTFAGYFTRQLTLFRSYATLDQSMFLEYLMGKDEAKAWQYVLHTLKTTETWRKDIVDIIRFKAKLLEGEKIVQEEEEDVSLDDVSRLNHLDDILKGTITSGEARTLADNMASFVIELKKEEKRLKEILEAIEQNLSILRQKVPFLFKKQE